jgi:F0F1-type ATP synthase gamma subunit
VPCSDSMKTAQRLRLRYNSQRQEEITEEIELILLSADMLSEAEHG